MGAIAAHGLEIAPPNGLLHNLFTGWSETGNEQASPCRERRGVHPALYAHRLGRAYGPDSSLAALQRAL